MSTWGAGRPRAVRWLVVAILVIALVAGGITYGLKQASDPDSDGDGISDSVEATGWRTVSNGVYVTDPDDLDTDDDGLTDGMEAGALRGSRYVGLSSPTLDDTDSDSLGDAQEAALDLSPRSTDTDRDDLPDAVEVEFGSDPTSVNPDGDSYDDKAEHERDSNPLSYDLTVKEGLEAFGKAVIPGDYDWARKGLNEAQVDSIEFLIGQMLGDRVLPVPITQIHDDLSHGRYVEACLRVASLLTPQAMAIKVGGTVAKHAARGAKAARVVYTFLRKHGSPTEWSREDLLELIGSAPRSLPPELEGGSEDHSVYTGRARDDARSLVGLTGDLAGRQSELGDSIELEVLDGATKLSRGEAMAIVEVLDERPDVHTIDPDADYYEQAVAWGEDWLAEHGHETVGEQQS